MGIEAKQHTLPPSLTAIPDELAAWLNSINKAWSWQEGGVENLSMLWGIGMEPLTEDYLKDAPEEVKNSVLSGNVGQRRLFINANGYFQSYDAVLCIQDRELRDANEKAWQDRRDAIEGGEAFVEGLEEELQRIGEKVGRKSTDPLLTGELESAAKAVNVSKKLRGITIND